MSLSGGIVFNNIKFDMIVSSSPLVVHIDRPDIKLKFVKDNPKKFQSCGVFILNRGYIEILKKIDIEIIKNISKENYDSPDYFITQIFHKQELLKEDEVKEIKIEKNYFCELCNSYFSVEDMSTYILDTKIGKCRKCLNSGYKK